MTTGTASHSDAGGAFTAPVRAGEVVAEKYRVEQTLGVGGMGVVVAATDEGLERRVAIKFLLPRLAGSETAVQRFVREARAATRITSEHVVRLLEIDKLPDGTPFFVMEYLEGRDLRAVLREDGPLAPSTAVDYVLQALQAIAEGHLKGIVHRDIKPGNLFLSARADGTPLIKVLDFGIAKRLEQPEDVAQSQLTSSDDVRLGSPAYMPPEQLHSARDVDTRSDIWSMGATLYELLSGRPPFEGQSYAELVSRILSAPPRPISTPTPARVLPQGLQEVMLRCLEKDREARYANAAELAAALAPYGSEDARQSLTRVVGLNALPSPPGAAGRVVSDSGGACTKTLATPDHVATRRSGFPSAPAPAKRSWIVVGGLAAILVTVFALRDAEPTPTPTKVAPTLPPAERAALNYPEPATERRAPAPETAVPAGADPAPTTSARPAPRARSPQKSLPTSAASSSAAPLAAPSVGATQPADRQDARPGRSLEIERLIESRR